MCRIDEPELYARHGATMSVGKKDALAKRGVPAETTDFTDDPLALCGEVFYLLPCDRSLFGCLGQESADVCLTSVTVQHRGIHGVCHEHVGADTDCDLIVALAVEAGTIDWSTEVPYLATLFVLADNPFRESSSYQGTASAVPQAGCQRVGL